MKPRAGSSLRCRLGGLLLLVALAAPARAALDPAALSAARKVVVGGAHEDAPVTAALASGFGLSGADLGLGDRHLRLTGSLAVESTPLDWLGDRVALGTDGIGSDLFEEGLRHLRRAVELSPEYAENHLFLAEAYADDGHHHHHGDHHHHDVNRHDERIRAFCLTYDRPLDWDRFNSWIEMLITLHGGDIDIRSAPGEGTTVTLAFPAAPGRAEEEGAGEQEAGERSGDRVVEREGPWPARAS